MKGLRWAIVLSCAWRVRGADSNAAVYLSRAINPRGSQFKNSSYSLAARNAARLRFCSAQAGWSAAQLSAEEEFGLLAAEIRTTRRCRGRAPGAS